LQPPPRPGAPPPGWLPPGATLELICSPPCRAAAAATGSRRFSTLACSWAHVAGSSVPRLLCAAAAATSQALTNSTVPPMRPSNPTLPTRPSGSDSSTAEVAHAVRLVRRHGVGGGAGCPAGGGGCSGSVVTTYVVPRTNAVAGGVAVWKPLAGGARTRLHG